MTSTSIACFSSSQPVIHDETPQIKLVLLLMLMVDVLATPLKLVLVVCFIILFKIWIWSFSGSFKIYHGVFHAIYQGLLLAKQSNYHVIICFTNSLLCVNILRVHTQDSTNLLLWLKTSKIYFIKYGMFALPVLSGKKIIVLIFLLSLVRHLA